MRKVLKIVGIIFLAVAFLGTVVLLYIFRSQSIDVDLLPSEFEYCGKQIWGANEKYIEITNWIKNNSEGWSPSYASYAPELWYSYPSYRIGLLKKGVVVSYKTDNGYPQFYKSINHGLSMACANGS